LHNDQRELSLNRRETGLILSRESFIFNLTVESHCTKGPEILGQWFSNCFIRSIVATLSPKS